MIDWIILNWIIRLNQIKSGVSIYITNHLIIKLNLLKP